MLRFKLFVLSYSIVLNNELPSVNFFLRKRKLQLKITNSQLETKIINLSLLL